MRSNNLAIIGNNGPADPALEASVAMIKTAVQTILAFEDTNTAFDAIMPMAASFEPRQFFLTLTLLRLVTRFGQDNPFDTQLLSQEFVLCRMNAPVRTGLVRWSAKLLTMMFKSR